MFNQFMFCFIWSTLLLLFFSLSPKLVIPALVAKFAIASFASKLSAANLLNSGVVIFLL